MSSIVVANKYTKVSCYGWSTKPKPKPLPRRDRVKRNQKSTWAKGGVTTETLYSGDLLQRMYEETDKDVARQRFPNQEDFKQAEKRMGKIMHSSEFIRRVLSLNRNLIYEDSTWYRGQGAFYVQRGQDKVYTGANFKLGWIPEWTIMKTDTADLPTRDGLTYGWRTVLQRLIQSHCIAKVQVDKLFGLVVHGDVRGMNWAIGTKGFN